ncbi:helix-turn-helix transcriptional regulator [Streptomyces sp. DSM 44938]|uniref:Helix-turn-helix transcriptional regulator n=2 Tax=Streptomyces litchfieldiae TaxID=3075543 RepID=A0ABU2MQF5_9ACTN|nr:helix-turn-helix transcriptional regulator [Streptomyces sp. DSM 44938]MDT0343133.1 helix-turn-helix transcriptional regulator [Streptomyces sp. DSM 44938]
MSYGTLAKRLHMSASTLHRYCKGEGLPPEFSTVERFARLCKATPEELMELHRRWIAADAARERARRPPSAVASEPGVAVPGPPPPRKGPRRRRVAALGGAVAVAFAVALAVNLLPGDGTGEGDTGAADVRDDGGSPAPFAVTTRPHAMDPCEFGFLVDAPTTEVPPPPFAQEAPGWVRALDAVVADEQLIELTIQGTENRTVVLQDMHVRVVEMAEPLPWNLYGGYSACGGGPVETAEFAVDLDAAAPEVTAGQGQDDFPLWVDEAEPLVLYVNAGVAEHDVTWYLELTWSSGDETGTLRVDNGGEPFRLSASTGQTRWSYVIGGTEWFDPGTAYDAEQ